MAMLQETLQGLDPLTLDAIVGMQLEDSIALAGSAKGKRREGTINDGEEALRMYTEELLTCQRVLEDRNMARSMARAVQRDGNIISKTHNQQDQVARDHHLAMSLDRNGQPIPNRATAPPSDQDMEDPWVRDEMLEKVAALYNDDFGLLDSDAPTSTERFDDSASAGQPESSAWAASRKGKNKQKLGTCVACGDTKDFFVVARVPCDHEYCRECLASLFQASMKDESLFPPRCDGQAILPSQVRLFLPTDLAKEFEARSVELGSKNRVYCHDPRCSTFIPAPADVERMEGDWLACPRCEKTTCTICKAAAHTGDCPNDTALQQLLDTAGTEQWQRCYQCKRFVKLETGCNHMTCPCGAHFCYVCGVKWKTCACPRWEEPRLYARAAQIANRNPNPRRRLFEPVRATREQPRTRRSSVATGAAAVAGGRPRSPSSASEWEDDFSDHSEWEHDKPAQLEDGSDDLGLIDKPVGTQMLDMDMPIIHRAPSLTAYRGLSIPADSAAKTETRSVKATQVIAAAGPSTARPTLHTSTNTAINPLMAHLRDNDECSHDKWRWIEGSHRCEECHSRSHSYIFECRQCMLQACHRCRRSRLS